MSPLPFARPWMAVPEQPYFTVRMDTGSFDLDAMPEDFQRGWEARGAHIPPLSTWRGLCGHLWDRAIEDTDICPRCGRR